MPRVEVAGFARVLQDCGSFEGVSPQTLEEKLAEAGQPLSIRILPASVDPILRSGQRLESLLFIQLGTVVPWQMPYSTLSQPYLLGEHEVLLARGEPQWVAHYSAIVDTTVVEIPLETMRLLLKVDRIRRNLETRVLRRLGRYYWTSLSTTGTNESKVAAALVSRLVLKGQDSGKDQRINDVSQTELVRLTATSRVGVSKGLRKLQEEGVIAFQGPRAETYLAGDLVVKDVDRLKEWAYSDIRADVERLVREPPSRLTRAAF